MIRLGIAPRLIDFLRGSASVIESWFNQVGVRLNLVKKAGAPVVAEVPENQWALFKNTTTGSVSLTVNDAGTLKSVLVPGTFPIAWAYQSVAQAIPTAVFTKVTMTSEVYDTDSCYDTTTSKFIPTVAGYYYLDGQGGLDLSGFAGAATLQLSISVNGTVVAFGQETAASTANTYFLQASGIYLLNGSTDYVELNIFQNTGANKNTITGNTKTRLNAHLIKAT